MRTQRILNVLQFYSCISSVLKQFPTIFTDILAQVDSNRISFTTDLSSGKWVFLDTLKLSLCLKSFRKRKF